MPYWQLKSIRDNQRAWDRSYYALPPDACPYCGLPLQVGSESEPGGGKLQMRHCPGGDYQYTGGTRLT